MPWRRARTAPPAPLVSYIGMGMIILYGYRGAGGGVACAADARGAAVSRRSGREARYRGWRRASHSEGVPTVVPSLLSADSS